MWAYPGAADLRLGYDGLAGLVANALGADPLSGDCFLFTNRARTRAKVLVWVLTLTLAECPERDPRPTG
ncbi:MAG: IS66 family insertion sequence element accessory protein TnpB [Steroidobacteraceae bacterium]